MTGRNVFAVLSAVVCVAGMSLLLAAPPQAEHPVPRAQPGNPGARTTDQRTAWRNNDHMFASCVAIDNQEEVALAKWAEEKSKNDDVQEFAKMLVSDHSEFIKKLHKWAPEATQDGFLTTERAPAGR